MTIKEIIVESLKLMFANDETLTTLSLEDLALNPNYSDYMCKMNGSIARAMKRIEVLEKAPYQYTQPIEAVQVVDENNQGTSDYYISMADTDNYRKILSINKKDKHGIHLNQSYYEIGQGEFLVDSAGWYTVIYSPKMPTYTDETLDTEVIPLPDDMVMLIPYFVKGELLEQEEPSMAANAMQYFENALAEIDNMPKYRQKRVKRVFT